jgi:hypothetical protein
MGVEDKGLANKNIFLAIINVQGEAGEFEGPWMSVYFSILRKESIRILTHDCSTKTLQQPNLVHHFYYFTNETLKTSDALLTSLTPYIQSYS